MVTRPEHPFSAPYAPPDETVAAAFLAGAPRVAAAERRIDARAARLIEGIRARTGGLGGIEDFLHAYSLSTQEGLALMVLAEALLRVPDSVTADRLIEDKLASGDWSSHDIKSNALLVSASAWTLGITARIIQPGETPDTILETLIKRLGLPAVRTATRQAMRLLGSHFVLGQTIEEALERAGQHQGNRYSFDMLGEGARTAADAARYLDAYAAAIAAIGAAAGDHALPDRPGISVKLSALHPRFEAISHARVLAELTPKLLELARKARDHDLNFTVDAEEADRLELTLDAIAAVLSDPSLRGWEGFGLAVQAYQKRAPAVIDWLAGAAQALRRRLMVRLVKGAYWDSEVKRAQERGLPDYPVFTRKAMTDLSYLHCTRKLLAARQWLFPQFATHNALTVASVIEDAGGVEGYEFQRLHGMGEVLYETLTDELPGAAVRVYAPVGGHRDLLAYLVRRLLRTARTPRSWRSRPIHRCRSRPFCGVRKAGSATPHMRAIQKFRCRAIFMALAAATRPGSSLATAQALRPSWPRSVALRRRLRPLLSSPAQRVRASSGWSARPSTAAWSVTHVKATRRSRAPPWRPRRRRSRPGRPSRSRSAQPRSNAPATFWRKHAAVSLR